MTFLSSPAKPQPNVDIDANSRNDPATGGVLHRCRCGSEVALTLKLLPGEGAAHLFARLAVAVEELDATILHLMVFGSVSEWEAGTAAMRRHLGRVDWPVSWVEGASCNGAPVAGVHVFARSGGRVERIRLGSRVVGSVFLEDETRHCVLGGLGPVQTCASRTVQTWQTLEQLERALGLAGFTLADTVRTWFFLDDILSWYDQFNAVRTEAYSGVRFHSGSLPASTGVGGRNSGGGVLSMSAWAVQGPRGTACVEGIVSPLQCPAPAYGSSFSRAMEISTGSGRRLFVSGTASICPEGRTMWEGNAQRQVARAMEVVEEILRSREFSLSNLIRATAYFRRASDLRSFARWCEARCLGPLPVVTAACEICREELLFELEAEAWRPGGS